MEKILNILKQYIPKKLFKALQPFYHFLLSWAAAVRYRFPSEKLIVVGVTGTTGKTTSVYLMAEMLRAAGYKTGYTSTAMFNNGRREWLNDKKMTMAGRFFTQKILLSMLENGCQYAIIETTSEGVRQYRHRFINYDVLVFTGLYPEHIESHGDFENYKKAKGRLFAHLKKGKTKYADGKRRVNRATNGIKKIELNRIKKTIIVNGDDEQADYFLSFWAEEKIAYINKREKLNIGNEIRTISYSGIKTSERSTNFKAGGEKIELRLLGNFNVINAMNAFSLGVSQGIGVKNISKGLAAVVGVPGRFERIDAGQKFTVIVDYAFEPRAVTKLYETINLISKDYSGESPKLIHVLGSAGGGRDKNRRPLLGKLAGSRADYAIITNEDPYDEDPQIIIDEVAGGALQAGKKLDKDLFKIIDRRKAIEKALRLAKPGDIVLITGKGCEQAICVANGNKIEWDDRKVVRELLIKMGIKRFRD